MSEENVSGAPEESLDQSNAGDEKEAGRLWEEDLDNSDSNTQPVRAKAESKTNSQKQASGKEKSQAQQLRELGEQDMDALVRVKIDGKEQTMKVRDALQKVALAESAQKRMQKAAQVRKEAESLLRMAKDNPKEFFKHTGIDPVEFAESTLAEKYELMQMSPEQRELMELRQDKQRRENEETQSKQDILREIKQYIDDLPEGFDKLPKEKLQQALQEVQQLHDDQRQGLDKDMAEAWKEAELPQDPYFVQLMAQEMIRAEEQKKSGMREKSLHPKEAAAKVKEKFEASIRTITEKMDGASLHRLLGDKVFKAIRDFEVMRVTGKQTPATALNKRPGQTPASDSQKAKKALSEIEWREHMAQYRQNLRD